MWSDHRLPRQCCAWSHFIRATPSYEGISRSFGWQRSTYPAQSFTSHAEHGPPTTDLSVRRIVSSLLGGIESPVSSCT